ncbi:hypothetical protein Huta_1456 [Halorhabdus utahensis DSM 12940]|uniref:Uncharacterized protein n=1 Tax=Halorhabdus utahensis (strain DSM 12940 / JCM 11049 / AX-2) TaxID=519442 RepID=C7NNV7_HALUD|nr:hypothetical protein Huta_1456 [Halorhabdus utahensis DSM 12940]
MMRRSTICWTDECALEAVHLDAQLRSQDIRLASADLLNPATAYAAGGTFVTHNATDFDKPPLYDFVDLDLVVTDSTEVCIAFQRRSGSTFQPFLSVGPLDLIR